MNNGPTCGAQTHMELLSGRPPDRQYKHTCTDEETDRQTDRQTVRQTKRERGLQLCIETEMDRLTKRQTELQRDSLHPARMINRQTDRKI